VAKGDILIHGEGHALNASIGNGSSGVTGSVGGDISVRGSSIALTTSNNGSFATIGNIGGNGASVGGHLTVTAEGLLSLTGGTNGRAVIGNMSQTGAASGSADGDIDVTSGTLIMSASGNSARTQIGNGRANATVGGDITVNSGDITIIGEGEAAFSRIGHTAIAESGDITGDIDVHGRNITLSTTGDGASNAVIGSGATGDITGDVTVVANNSGSVRRRYRPRRHHRHR
jgi:hypothetical protein